MNIVRINAKGELELADGLLLVDPFKRLKETYTKEEEDTILKFLFFVCDTSSPYADIPESLREVVIKKDYLRSAKFVTTDIIKECIDKYRELQLTSLSRLKRQIKNKLDELTDTLEDIKMSQENISIFNEVLKSANNALKAFDILDPKIGRETTKTKGDIDVGDFER